MSATTTKEATEIISLRMPVQQMREIRKDHDRRRKKDEDAPRFYTLSSHIRFLIDTGLRHASYQKPS
jgi:hypothetical protein